MVEALIVIAILLVLAAALLPALARAKKKSARIGCANCLKETYLGLRIWSGDHGNLFPMQVPADKGGAMEEAQRGNVAPIFQAASNEISTPKILWCPYDNSKTMATNFTTDFRNDKISYFVDVDAVLDRPGMFLAGDDNFQVAGMPAKSGLLLLPTNASIAWDSTRHVRPGFIKHENFGNVAFADGSVQELTTPEFRGALAQTPTATNRLAIP